MKKNNKQKKIVNTSVTINGINYDFGKLYTTTKSYSPASKKYTYDFKCLITGKKFTDITELSKHLVNTLISNKKVKL